MAGGRVWEPEEDQLILDMVAQGASNSDIVLAFRERWGTHARTAAAIKKRRADMSGDDGRHDNGAEKIADSLRDYTLLGGSFVFVIEEKMLAVPFDRWDAICRDYSTHGTDMTAAEIARKYGIPLPVLRRCLNKYGQYKASPPNCRERIEEHKDDLEPLVQEAIENDEHRFLQALDSRRDKEWRADYIRLKREETVRERVLAAARELAGHIAPPVIPSNVMPPKKGEPWVAHLPTTDEHAGKLVWARESFGEDLDTYITAARIRTHADRCVEWIQAQPGRCEVAHRTFLGDLFHALMGETEHGTKLDQDTRSAKVLMHTTEAVVYALSRLAQVCDRVEVRGAKGNHDGFLFTFWLEYLRARMDSHPNIHVYAEPSPYATFRIGSTLHVLDHGYRIGNLDGWKAKAQAEVVARQIGGSDYHGAEMVYTYVGHMHEETRASHGSHLKLIRLPSIGESDDYETSLRYNALPSAHLFRLNSDGRIDTEKVLYRQDLTS